MSPPNCLSFIIVGAGIGGLSAATALRQAGHKVTVLEKVSLKSEAGLAITLYPNATRTLMRWGMDLEKARMNVKKSMETFHADVTPMKSVVWEDMSAHKMKDNAPFCLSHRVDLHQGLRDLAVGADGPGTPAELITSSAVVSFDAQKGSVTLEDGSVMTANVVIAADGLHSRAHEQVLGERRPVRSTGITTIRFMIPTEDVLANPDVAWLVGGDGQAKVYVTQDNTRLLIQYPCRNNQMLNFGAFAYPPNYGRGESEEQVQEQQEQPNHQADRQDLLHRLERFDPAILQLCQMTGEILPLWKCCDRDPLPKFYLDKLVLIGDACHPMLPHLGQGATAAIEDAGVLGAVFKDVGGDREQIPKRLEIWEKLRRNRVSAVQLFARYPPQITSLPPALEKQMKEFFPEGQVPIPQ